MALVLGLLLLLLTGCGGAAGGGGDGGAGVELSRIRLDVAIGADGPLLLDLASDPPTIVPAPGSAPVPVVDLDAAGLLVEHVRSLPVPQDCRLDRGAAALVRVMVLPPPDIAERADASVEECGGACDPPGPLEVERLLELWHATAGDDTWQPDVGG